MSSINTFDNDGSHFSGLEAAHEARLQAPRFKQPYDATDVTVDLPCMAYALEEFLASGMQQSEEYLNRNDPRNERLYTTMGKSLIKTFTSMMSWDREDIEKALGVAKVAVKRASEHRAKNFILPLFLFEYGLGPFHFRVKAMSDSERHAELVYAETMIFKAMLGIVSSGSWFSFFQEIMNMRLALNSYLALHKYITSADKVFQKHHPGHLHDPSVDRHFRSGVELGVGIANLILSSLPRSILVLLKMVGYSGDRAKGIRLLMNIGGWVDGSEPRVGIDEEGIRRPIADLALLVMHLVASIVIFNGVSSSVAARITAWNSVRFPQGPMYLMAQARLCLIRCAPTKAIPLYEASIASQKQLRQLHHACWWELASCNIALWNVKDSYPLWRQLMEESNWSKCAFTYATAICLLEMGGADHEKEAAKLMAKVPSLLQKIAGVYIPYEEILADKAKTFARQGRNRLVLPMLEFAYIFFMIPYFPPSVLASKVIPGVKAARSELDIRGEGAHQGWWDDWCLTKFLEGMCLRCLAYPVADAIVDQTVDIPISSKEAEAEAKRAFDDVFRHGSKVEVDHWIVYHAHFEYGRLLTCQGDHSSARKQLEMVLSGKALEVHPKLKKTKYRLKIALEIRANAALEPLSRR